MFVNTFLKQVIEVRPIKKNLDSEIASQIIEIKKKVVKKQTITKKKKKKKSIQKNGNDNKKKIRINV